MEFNLWLKKERNKKGLTQVVAAALLGFSRSVYLKLESGEKEPSAVVVAGIEKILGELPDKK